jgi:hypothetical protein
MPQPNEDARRRISAMVRYVESNGVDNTSDPASGSVFHSEVPVMFKNGAGEIIPKYGVVSVTGGEKK